MAWNLSIKGNYFYAIDTENPFTVNDCPQSEVRIAKSNTSSTSFRLIYRGIDVTGMSEVPMSDIIAENGTDFTDLATFETWKNENTGKSNASVDGAKLVWSSTGDQEQNIAIVQDTETLIEILNMPFADYNASDLTFDTLNNWIDVSGIDSNAWLTTRVSYLGGVGSAEVTSSFRLIPDRNDLNSYFSIHGQTSTQIGGKTSSYIVEGFIGNTDVLQIFIETDKNETLSVKSISIKIELP